MAIYSKSVDRLKGGQDSMSFRTLRREGDAPILRHTDLDGACAIAEPRKPKLDVTDSSA